MKSELLTALASVTQADLDEITAEIDTHTQAIDRLKGLKQVIEIQLGIRKPQGAHLRGMKRGKRKATIEDHESTTAAQSPAAQPDPSELSVTDQYRLKIKRYLMANGPQSQGAICKQCGVPVGSITNVLKHAMFKHTAKGVELTSAAY